jgi:hypothetical protein
MSKNRDDDDGYNVVRSNLQKSLTQRLEEREYGRMSSSQVESARMTKVSYINLREGTYAAQSFTKKHLKDWLFDKELSNEHGSVFENRRTGEVRVAYRGTQTMSDWGTNGRMAVGLSGGQFDSIEGQIYDVELKYGKMPDVLSGHSKGGGQAILMGEKFGINTHTQDPFIPTQELVGLESNAQHSVVRTPTDWVSAGANLTRFRDGFDVVDISPVGTSVLESHDLGLMTGVSHESTGNTTYAPDVKNKAFLSRAVEAGQSFSEIAAEVGYGRGTPEYKSMRHEYKAIRSEPKTHMVRAGFVPKVAPSAIVSAVSRIGGGLSAVVGEGAVKIVNAQSAAGILGGVVANTALRAAGVNDDVVLATASGAIGNASADAAGAGVRALTGVGVEAAEMGLLGVAASSLARGGAGGLLGFGAERAVSSIGHAIHLDDNITSVTASIAGGAASGMIFGPEGAALGAAIGGVIGGIESIWRANQPTQPTQDFMLQPYRHRMIDSLIGNDRDVHRIVSEFNRNADFGDRAIEETQDRITDRVRQMQIAHGWTHKYDRYTAVLQSTPRGTQTNAVDGRGRSTVMLGGDYNPIIWEERDIHNAAVARYEADENESMNAIDSRYNARASEATEIANSVSNQIERTPTHEVIHSIVAA